MAKKLNVLVDTDVFIDYFNHRLCASLFETNHYQVYYSVVTKKELLSKQGLKDQEKREIKKALKRYRLVSLEPDILQKYTELRQKHPTIGKEDCLIAATALCKKFPLATRNYRHYRVFKGLKLFF